MAKILGIGGVFFKSTNPDALKSWYKTTLGLNTDAYGTNFVWRNPVNPEQKNFTQWSPFKQDTDYFLPSKKDFMINYIVDDLATFKNELLEKGVQIIDEIAEYEYGKFLHIMDSDGNAIELWQPVWSEYEPLVNGQAPTLTL